MNKNKIIQDNIDQIQGDFLLATGAARGILDLVRSAAACSEVDSLHDGTIINSAFAAYESITKAEILFGEMQLLAEVAKEVRS